MRQRVKQRIRRGLRLFLIALFILGSLQLEAVMPSAKAVTQAEIDALAAIGGAITEKKRVLVEIVRRGESHRDYRARLVKRYGDGDKAENCAASNPTACCAAPPNSVSPMITAAC